VSDASLEIQYTSRERIWSKLNKCLLVFIGAGIALPLLYRSLPVVKEKLAQDSRAGELEMQLENARMEHNRLKREVSLLETDSEYLENFARDRLPSGLMKEGELIFRIENR
jgi:cell division protein FtsB